MGAAGYALSFDGVNDYVIIGETNTVMGGATWQDTMSVRPLGEA